MRIEEEEYFTNIKSPPPSRGGNYKKACQEKGLPGKRPQAKRPMAKQPPAKRPPVKRPSANRPSAKKPPN